MWKIIDTRTGKTVAGNFTHKTAMSDDDKQAAKPVRDRMNGSTGSSKDGNKPRYVIARGPKHPKGETDGFDHTYKPQRWL